MGTGRSKSKEAQRQADESIARYAQPTPLEQLRNDQVMGFLRDWESGKDVKDISYLNPYLDLYNQAAAESEPYAGEGIIANNALSGASGNIAAQIGQQLASRRKQQAAGQLYNAANAAYQTATGRDVPFLVGTEVNRRGDIARLKEQRYYQMLANKRQPGFWERLLQSGIQAGAQALSMP